MISEINGSTEINGGALRPLYHLSSNVISAAVGFVYINLQCEYMSFLAPLVSDNSRSLEKFELGAQSPATLKKKFYTGLSSCS